MTDELAELVAAAAEEPEPDPEVLEAARRIAERLVLRERPDEAERSHARGRSVPAPFRPGLDELDLDRTIDRLEPGRRPTEADLVLRDRVRTPRAVVLAVDVSGSMRGERVRTAAAALGGLAGALRPGELSVVAFWSEAAWLLHLGGQATPRGLVDGLLALPTRGLTNVGFPLELAAAELARVAAPRSRVVLLSDCVHNAGPDPRPLAAALPRVDVLLDVTQEHDAELGRELARIGGGRLHPVRGPEDVVSALADPDDR